ncbi:MAG: MFS transporter [Oscillospiraceae bacterium]|nr:MFS transporter [Oscillospiraceae bacterium]
MSENKIINKKGVHYGWVIVFVGFLAMWFITCVFTSVSGMMITPVTEELGISRSRFAMTSTAASVAGMIISVYIGKTFRKYTVKKTMLFGAALFAACYAAYGLAPNIWVFYIIGFFSGFGMVMSSMVAISTLLTRWFDEKRGFALALASTGSGVGGVIMNPLLASMVTSIGWRKTHFVLGAMIAVVMVPAIILLVKESPREMGLEPYGKKTTAESGVATVVTGFTSTQAKKTPMYRMWIPVVVIVQATFNTMMAHTVAYATDMGFVYTAAARIASLMTAGLAVWKLVIGHLYDTAGTRKAATVSLSVFAIVLMLYAISSKEMAFIYYIAVALYGIGGSFVTIAFSVIVQDIFGKKDYATIYGNVNFFASIGGGIGSPIVAAVFDNFGTYKPAWWGLSILMWISVVLINMTFKAKEKYDR